MVRDGPHRYAVLASQGSGLWIGEAKATMRGADEVLQRKELEIQRVKEEIKALRVAAQLLREKGDPAPAPPKKTAKILRMR
jgi:hypothetical protein